MMPGPIAPMLRPRSLYILTAIAVLLYAATATPAAAAASADPGARVDGDWVLKALARPVPMRTSFVEFRASRLLKAPLRLSGEYRRPDANTLVREVRAPYAETTTIRDGEATLARAGKSPRTFSLSRVPELAALQASFGALLSGDRITLERYYRIATDGTRQRWTMTLVPKQTELASQLRDIVLYGRGVELRCIESTPEKGDVQRTLLAGAARSAGADLDADAVVALCRGEAQ